MNKRFADLQLLETEGFALAFEADQVNAAGQPTEGNGFPGAAINGLLHRFALGVDQLEWFAHKALRSLDADGFAGRVGKCQHLLAGLEVFYIGEDTG